MGEGYLCEHGVRLLFHMFKPNLPTLITRVETYLPLLLELNWSHCFFFDEPLRSSEEKALIVESHPDLEKRSQPMTRAPHPWIFYCLPLYLSLYDLCMHALRDLREFLTSGLTVRTYWIKGTIALSTTFGRPKENTYYRIHHHRSPAVAEPISLSILYP